MASIAACCSGLTCSSVVAAAELSASATGALSFFAQAVSPKDAARNTAKVSCNFILYSQFIVQWLNFMTDLFHFDDYGMNSDPVCQKVDIKKLADSQLFHTIKCT